MATDKSGDAEPELDGLVLLAAYSTADLTDSGLPPRKATMYWAQALPAFWTAS